MNKNQTDVLNEIYELKELEEKYKKIKSQYEAKKLKLSDSIKAYMSKVKCENLRYIRYKGGIAKRGVKATKVCPKKIIWDVDKLEKKLDKELLNEILEKQYVVNNMEGLIKYLKSCGVNPKQFKKYITTEKKVNQKKIDNLSKIGEIELDDLDGCYEVKELSSYLKIEYLENIEKDED